MFRLALLLIIVASAISLLQSGNAVVLPACQYVQQYDKALQHEAGCWYFHGQLLNGYIIQTDRKGKLLYLLPIQDGKEDGLAIGWYNTGELMMARHFRKGNKEGLFEQWWPNGHYRYLFHYTNNQWNGVQWVFFPNGKLQQQSNYSRGNEAGRQRAWDEQGNLITNYNIQNNKLYGIKGSKSCLPGIGH